MRKSVWKARLFLFSVLSVLFWRALLSFAQHDTLKPTHASEDSVIHTSTSGGSSSSNSPSPGAAIERAEAEAKKNEPQQVHGPEQRPTPAPIVDTNAVNFEPDTARNNVKTVPEKTLDVSEIAKIASATVASDKVRGKEGDAASLELKLDSSVIASDVQAVAPSPDSAIEDVFVPLEKWKEQKLQDIETRVKQHERKGRLQPLRKPGMRGKANEPRNREVEAIEIEPIFILSRRQIFLRSLFASTCPRRENDSSFLMHGSWVTDRFGKDDSVGVMPRVALADKNDLMSLEEIPADGSRDKTGVDFSGSKHTSTAESGNAEAPLPDLYIGKSVPGEDSLSDVGKTITLPDAEVLSQPISAINSASDGRDISEESLDELYEPKNNLSILANGIIADAATDIAEVNSRNSHLRIAKVEDILRSLKESKIGKLSLDRVLSLEGRREYNNSTVQKVDKFSSNHLPLLTENVHGNQMNDVKRRTRRLENGINGRLPKERSHLGLSVKYGDLQRLLTGNAPTVSGFGGVKDKPFNFASSEAGARILASSSNAVGTKHIITENRDKYMLVPCAGDGIGGSRWVDMELSEDVFLHGVQTANYEHYSSSPSKVVVLGAKSYPPKKWNILGVFNFANVRTIQHFEIKKYRSSLTRYLRIVYAGKQGSELYCPISVFRAFGKNLLSDWKDEDDRLKQIHAQKPMEDHDVLHPHPSSPESLLDSSAEHPHSVMEEASYQSTDRQIEKPIVSEPALESETVNVSKNSKTAITSEYRSSMGEKETLRKPGNLEGDSFHNPPEVSPFKIPENSECAHNSRDAVKDHKVYNSAEPNGASRRQTEREPLQSHTSADENLSNDDRILLKAVREDALSPEPGDENIFRRVTRMIRLLEVNQSLTNQYIDTHLSRYATALAAARVDAAKSQEAAAIAQARLASLASATEEALNEMSRAAFRRDVMLCALLVLVSFLLVTHWIMWAAWSSPRSQLSHSGQVELDSYASDRCCHGILLPGIHRF